jgi:hypothetical protein
MTPGVPGPFAATLDDPVLRAALDLELDDVQCRERSREIVQSARVDAVVLAHEDRQAADAGTLSP